MLDRAWLTTAPACHLFTVDEWRRMGERGLFAPDDRLELLSGVVLEMAPIGPRHASCVGRLMDSMLGAARTGAVLRLETPVQLDDRSEPVPDLLLLRPPAAAYDDRNPRPADVYLVVEVADTTLAYDLGPKARAYARAGVPETWVVDLSRPRVVILTDPAAGGYRTTREARAGDVIAPSRLPRCPVDLAAILPRPAAEGSAPPAPDRWPPPRRP